MIKYRDGIQIQSDKKYVADSYSESADFSIISHAHADHAVKKNSGNVICSDLTHKIAEKRFDIQIDRVKPSNIELYPSGHIIGSSSILIDDKVLYTGDVSLRDRAYINGFEPVDAEKLVIESTYGIPAYSFPDQREVEGRIKDWIREENRTLFLFAYSLGKAQKIQHLVQKVTDRPIIAHESIIEMNEVIEGNTDLEFRALPYKDNKELLENNGIMIAPSRSSKADYMEKLVDKHNGVKAGFSGWAAQESFKYRGGYDETFVFSDHCDFNELVDLVEKVDPNKVYTHHGFDEEFASYLSREKGFNARALKNNQSSLTDF